MHRFRSGHHLEEISAQDRRSTEHSEELVA